VLATTVGVVNLAVAIMSIFARSILLLRFIAC
jgi:hypothetical protein